MIKEEREEGVIEQWLLWAKVSEVLWKKPACRGVVRGLVTAAVNKGVKMKVVPLRLIWYFLPFKSLIKTSKVCFTYHVCVVTYWCMCIYHSLNVPVLNNYTSLAFYVQNPKCSQNQNFHRKLVNFCIKFLLLQCFKYIRSPGSRSWAENSWRLGKQYVGSVLTLFYAPTYE